MRKKTIIYFFIAVLLTICASIYVTSEPAWSSGEASGSVRLGGGADQGGPDENVEEGRNADNEDPRNTETDAGFYIIGFWAFLAISLILSGVIGIFIFFHIKAKNRIEELKQEILSLQEDTSRMQRGLNKYRNELLRANDEIDRYEYELEKKQEEIDRYEDEMEKKQVEQALAREKAARDQQREEAGEKTSLSSNSPKPRQQTESTSNKKSPDIDKITASFNAYFSDRSRTFFDIKAVPVTLVYNDELVKTEPRFKTCEKDDAYFHIVPYGKSLFLYPRHNRFSSASQMREAFDIKPDMGENKVVRPAQCELEKEGIWKLAKDAENNLSMGEIYYA